MGLFNDVGDQTIHRQPGPAGPEGPARPAGPQGPPGFKKHLMETMMQKTGKSLEVC